MVAGRVSCGAGQNHNDNLFLILANTNRTNQHESFYSENNKNNKNHEKKA